ncbi:MAG: putative DNA binding domain-containing protein [Acidimicrobiaceae bacterium]|nr:putative DNA binding domain-containing protein [Acidimicrobiia bacterium]MCY4494487.1 putative DNA binding domain-containing protein [Acidimicrobiaceae bacterium]
MDPDEVAELASVGETLTVEFKGGGVGQDDLAEAVVCLANADGGRLLLGVTDNGAINGINPDKKEYADPQRLAATISTRTEPPITVAVETVTVENELVAVIEVPASDSVHATSRGRYVRRTVDVKGSPQCLPMRPHEVLAAAAGETDFSQRVLDGILLEDLDGNELNRMRGLARQGDGDNALSSLSDTELLRALSLVDRDDRLTVGAVLLFGTAEAIRRHVPAHEIGFQELDGTEIRANEISHNPLLRAMAQLVERVDARNTEEDVEVGLFRIPLPQYAESTIRELIANSLVHRDYTKLGPTLVRMNGGSLTVSNPGGFPPGVNTSNLMSVMPRPRNPALAEAFKRAGLVDRVGRGISRVFEQQLSLGRPPPDYSGSTTDSVIVRVRSGPADSDLAGYIAQFRRSGEELDLRDLLTLHEIRAERRITTARAAELFQIDTSSARAELNALVERGLLESRGESRARTYHMSAALYRQLGELAEYVRTKGFEKIQQREMVLTFVERHGSISRGEAAELCQIAPLQAGHLLRQLRDSGELAMTGERRTARYTARPKHS